MKPKIRKCILGLAATAILSTGGFTTKAFALDPAGWTFFGDLGHCKVRIRNYGNNGSAAVTLGKPGDPAAGGSQFISGRPVRTPAIKPKDIAQCGIQRVRKFKADGANGSFASDNYVGFSFEGWYKGTRGFFEYAITKRPGEARSHAVYSYYFYSTPQVKWNR